MKIETQLIDNIFDFLDGISLVNVRKYFPMQIIIEYLKHNSYKSYTILNYVIRDGMSIEDVAELFYMNGEDISAILTSTLSDIQKNYSKTHKYLPTIQGELITNISAVKLCKEVGAPIKTLADYSIDELELDITLGGLIKEHNLNNVLELQYALENKEIKLPTKSYKEVELAINTLVVREKKNIVRL